MILERTYRTQHTATFEKSFLFNSINLWNKLPADIQSLDLNLGNFCKNVCKHIMGKRDILNPP